MAKTRELREMRACVEERGGLLMPQECVVLLDEIEQLRELLADLAMEGKILGLGDTVAEVNDQTGVLGRVRATLGSDFLDGRSEHLP